MPEDTNKIIRVDTDKLVWVQWPNGRGGFLGNAVLHVKTRD